jgi:oxalate---CoA ligase
MDPPPYLRPYLSTLVALPLPSGRPALVTDPAGAARVQSHESLRRAARAIAAGTVCPRAARGAAVALLLPNDSAFVAAFLAVAHAGCVAAPLNPRYTRDELAFYIEDARATLVLVEHHTAADAPIVDAAGKLGVEIVRLPESLPESTGDQSPEVERILEDRKPGPADVALFLHTSGTTSRPKGVPLTHANLCASIANIAETYKLTTADANVLVMPLFHVHGLMSATLATLATEGTIALPPGGKFSASAFWPAVVASKATWYTAVPTIHQILLARAEQDFPEHNPPKLRFIRSCSSSLAPSILGRLEEAFGAPVLEAYAMTEASHQMTSNPLPNVGVAKPGTVGLPQNVELAILGGSKEILPPNVIGEVCIRGANVTAGYQNNPKANEEAFAGGWFHTGDQGKLDENGYLSLTGRIKELVNRGGEKISPLEVDAALLSHPAVTEAVSFAVPDEKYGEEVNAAVILKAESGEKVSAADLTAFAKERLSDFKVPKRFFIADDLPRTATGKIQRRIVAKHFLDQLASGKSSA